MDELRQHAAIYINSDTNSRGFLEAAGSHTLERFVTQVARDVEDPERHVSVLERYRAHRLDEAANIAERSTRNSERKELRERDVMRLSALGSGSDYTAFLQHAGVASLNIAYGGEGEGGR